MGKASAKIKGAASKLGAALSGKVGILSTLEGEHTEVDSLMDSIVEAKDDEKRRELYRKVRQELMIQSQGEEQGLYTECRSHDSTRALADKAVQDQMEVKRLLVEIDGLNLGTPEWTSKFHQLQTTVDQHVKFEENQLYPAVKSTLGTDALRDLDGRYKAHRKRIEERGEVLDPMPM